MGRKPTKKEARVIKESLPASSAVAASEVLAESQGGLGREALGEEVEQAPVHSRGYLRVDPQAPNAEPFDGETREGVLRHLPLSGAGGLLGGIAVPWGVGELKCEGGGEGNRSQTLHFLFLDSHKTCLMIGGHRTTLRVLLT